MARTLRDTPWPVLLLVLSFLCPTELSLWLGSARLPPHRALLLVLLPFALVALFGRRGVKLRLFDVSVLLFAVWQVGIYIYHHGQADGLQSGGALALDSFGSFLVARACVRDARSLAATASMLFGAVVLSGLVALPETLTGQFYVHDALRQLTGYGHPTLVEKRLGLTRAFGTFDHPIHLGTFCASGLAFCIYACRRDAGAVMRALLIAGAALTSLSSAPMLSLAVQAGLVSIERVSRAIKGRVAIGFGVLALGFLALSLVGNRSPFAMIATGLTLDSWTGYYRLVIWEWGLATVGNHLWTGIGLNDWDRPWWMNSSTVDAFWLVIAMRGGAPALLLLVAAIGLLVRGVARASRRAEPGLRRMATGWMISLAALSLVACTVHYWNVPFAYFFFFLGLGGALADPLRQPARALRQAVAGREAAARLAWVAPDALPAGVAPGAGVAAPAPAWAGAPRWPVPLAAAAAPQPPRPAAARARR